jgi:hypothetical protein
MNGSDITEQYLNKLYEDLSKEQMRLMNDLKSSSNIEGDKEKDITKQFTFLNTLMTTALRYRNLKRKIIQKINL